MGGGVGQVAALGRCYRRVSDYITVINGVMEACGVLLNIKAYSYKQTLGAPIKQTRRAGEDHQMTIERTLARCPRRLPCLNNSGRTGMYGRDGDEWGLVTGKN